MSKLSVAVVGMGLGLHHVEAYCASSSVDRVVLCDLNQDRLDKVQQQFPEVAAVYTDLPEMLKSEKLDAISVATPDHFHVAHATAVLRAGINLLLTKPIATNVGDAERIVRHAEDMGVHLMVAHEARFRSRSLKLKQMIQDGFFGEIIHIRMDAIHDKRRQFSESPWYASAEAGRSATIGTGIHEVDLLRFLVGQEVVCIKAIGNSLGPLAFPKDKTICALFTFEGGAIGQTTISYEARWSGVGAIDDGFRLIGSKGMAVGHKAFCDGMSQWMDLPRDKDEVKTGTQSIVTAFIGSLATGAPIAVTGADALVSLKLCEAVDQAASTDAFLE